MGREHHELSAGSAAGEVLMGPYRLELVLGRGGMGVVHRARQVETGALVALKTVAAVGNPQLSALRSEIRALARLKHPGVVRILDEGLSAGTPWYAMELLEGETLSARLDRLWDRHLGADESTYVRGDQDGSGPSSWDRTPHLTAPPTRPAMGPARIAEAIVVIRKLCQALAYVHDQGIVHRDLKPSNVFLRTDGSPVLIDFGLVSRFQGASGRENLDAGTAASAGTRAYMAPEQLGREQVDARADLYALGCLIFELLTGHVPSDPTSLLRRRAGGPGGSPPRPSELVDGIPPALDDLVARLLAWRPQERMGYAADVIEMLDGMEAGREVRGRTSPSPAAPRSYLYRPRLAGRGSEIASLWPRIEGIRTAETRVTIYLGGESGCGKTMLVNQLARQATAAGILVIAGECRPLVGESTVLDPHDAPLHPFRPLLRAVADRCRAGGPRTAARLLGSWGKLLAHHEPALDGVPGQDECPTPPPLSGEAARDRLLGAFRDVLVALAGEAPLLLILDDLQWADELSLALLRSLSGEVLARTPLAVLGTYRSDELSPALQAIVDDPLVERVTLGRLDMGAVSSMVADMLGMLEAPAPLANFLLRASEGNPFFVAEYLRAAAAEGFLVREQGRWHLPGVGEGSDSAYDRIQLPHSVRGLVSRRLAGLSPGARALASKAAVLGRTADLAALAALHEVSPEQLTEPLAELVSRQVIDRDGGRYSFVHDKIRESAYQHVAEAERPLLHLRAAEVLEALSDDPDPFQLASHYRHGERPDKAFRYTRLAGRRALEAGAFREARAHLRSALTIAETQSGALPELSSDERADLRRLLGETLVVCGDLGEGIDNLRRACEEMGIPAPARTRPGWIWLALREIARWTAAAGPLGRWLRLSDEGRRTSWTAGSDMNRSVSMAYLFLVRPLECVAALFLSGRLAEEAGADGQRAAAYPFTASVCGMVGLRRLSLRLYASARAAVAASDEVLPLLWQVSSEAVFHHYLNADWQSLERCTAPALARADQNHLVHDRHPVEFAVAMGELEQGKLAAARTKLERIHARAVTFGHQQYIVSARGALVLCDLYAGRFVSIAESSASVIALHSGEKNVDLFIVLSGVAVARLRMGDSPGALAMAERACAIMEAGAQLEGRPLAVRVLYDLGEVLTALWREALVQGRTPERRLVRRTRAVRRKLARLARRRRHIQPGALLLEAHVHQVEGRADLAAKILRRVCQVAASLQTRPFEAFARFELARQGALATDVRRQEIERAIELFDHMGYAWHLERARLLALQIGAIYRDRNLA